LRRTVVVALLNKKAAYQQLLQADAERSAARLGFAVEVLDGGDEVTNQIRQVRDCIRRPEGERPYAVVVFPARDKPMERLAEEVVGEGVGLIVLNRRAEYIEALRARARGLPLAVVGPDQKEVGRLQAQQARALVSGNGYVLCVQGVTMSSAAQDRLTGLREGLAGTSLKLAQVIGNWDAEQADHAVGSWLEMVVPSRLQLGVVACQNDAMGVGAWRALTRIARELARPELARVPVTGAGGIAHEGRKDVDEGRLAATIVLPSSTGPALELLARSAHGQDIPSRVELPVTSYPDLEGVKRRRTA
jgi:ABC-type sugar transport system substrate-binding protein